MTATATAIPAIGALPARAAAPPSRRTPFTLGVASGDPWPDSVILWTRLALNPLAEDGRGGMPAKDYPIQWQVGTDPELKSVVKSGNATARTEFAHAVHVEVKGLAPNRPYWYRFKQGNYLSAIAQTRTAPKRGTTPDSLSMSMVSCSQFEHGWFTAYRRLAEDRPELILHLGDYQYEYKKDSYVAGSGNVRDHEGEETTTLAGYRQRHAQYKSDLDLQAAHAIAPWLVVWDDHEIDNNWAGEVPEKPEIPQPNFLERRRAAFRAYYENMPLRASSAPQGLDMQLFRRVYWGELATFHMMDTRQYRDDQGCGDGYKTDCPAAVDPARTITGDRQEQWLLKGFEDSRARWDILGQQVFYAQRDNNADAPKTVSMDGWDGYAASRQRITQGWVDAGVRNPVVLTGDVHAHWASDIKINFDDPNSPVVGSELVCSSITSGGDGADSASGAHPWLGWNQHLKFQNNLRGYVNTKITKGSIEADFRCLPKVSEAGHEVFTRASFAIADGERGLVQTADNPPAVTRMDGRTTTSITSETVAWETNRP